jgi:hypothetical protein
VCIRARGFHVAELVRLAERPDDLIDLVHWLHTGTLRHADVAEVLTLRALSQLTTVVVLPDTALGFYISVLNRRGTGI